jgi:shikimate kinase
MSSDAPTRIVITGFMAAGKTALARALAERLGCAAVDTDESITAREGRTPAEIIDAEGEPAFRRIETRALRDALARAGPLVVALGGGAWTIQENRDLVAAAGCLALWLDAPFDLCWHRITHAADAPERPLARDRARALALYDARRYSYALAPLRVAATPGKSPDALAREIAKLLRPTQHEPGAKPNQGERIP